MEVENIQDINDMMAEIIQEDVREALTKAKNNKAPWLCNLRMKLLTYSGKKVDEFIKEIFYETDLGAEGPVEWNTYC